MSQSAAVRDVRRDPRGIHEVVKGSVGFGVDELLAMAQKDVCN